MNAPLPRSGPGSAPGVRVPEADAVVRVRHELRVRTLAVVRREQVSPGMLRLTLGGEALDGFASAAPDDHVKLRFPRADGTVEMRDYTPRRFDAGRRELVVEFVLHGHGPAAEWARSARVGDPIEVAGPRGSRLLPERDGLLLVGDETALPAIGRWLEELRPGTRALAIVEVADAREARRLPSAGNAEVVWVSREGAAAGEAERLEAALDAAVARGAVPPGRVTAWVAAEIEVARRLRTGLIERHGMRREAVTAVGYWRMGVPDGHGRVED